MYGDEVMSMLTVQYRMHELIMNWSSKELYSSKVLRSCLDVGLRSILSIMDCKKLVIFVKKKRRKLCVTFCSYLLLQVKAHPSVAAHMLFDLEGVKRTSSTEPNLLLIDIAGYAVYCCHMLYNTWYSE